MTDRNAGTVTIDMDRTGGSTSATARYGGVALGTVADRGDGSVDFIPSEELSQVLLPETTDDLDGLRAAITYEIAQKRRQVHRALDLPEPYKAVGVRTNLFLAPADDEGFSDIYVGDEQIGVVHSPGNGQYSFVPSKYYDNILTETDGDSVADMVERLEFTLVAGKTLIEQTLHFPVQLRAEGTEPLATFSSSDEFIRAALSPSMTGPTDPPGDATKIADHAVSDLKWDGVEKGTTCKVYMLEATGDVIAIPMPTTHRFPCALLGYLPRAEMIKSADGTFRAVSRKVLGHIEDGSPLSTYMLALKEAHS